MRLLKSESAIVYVIDRHSPFISVFPQNGERNYHHCSDHFCITEAEREGWTGEAEGLRVSLAAANNKIAQADLAAARRAEAVHLGIPAYRDIAATTVTAPGDRHAR